MSPRLVEPFAKIFFAQFGAIVTTHALAAIFASRVLLLSPEATRAAVHVILAIGAASLLGVALTMTSLFRPLAGALRSISEGGEVSDVVDIFRLHRLPARVVYANTAFVVVASILVVASPLRPSSLDTSTTLSLVFFVMMMRSTAALPAFLMARAALAQTLEFTSIRSTSAALRKLHHSARGRLSRRFVSTSRAPILFIALGASALVVAQVHAYDRTSRTSDAVELARSVFEPLSSRGVVDEETDRESLRAAQRAAKTAGFDVRFDDTEHASAVVDRARDGRIEVVVPSESGAISGIAVGFDVSPLSSVVAVYALLVIVAWSFVTFLSQPIGRAFESDLVIATQLIEHVGVADVMRGTRIMHHARFTQIDELLQAVDALGDVFREFARAQKRAIDARSTTERMRGFLLASMSHDLKAPLNAVLGFAALVGRNPLAEGQRENLAIIEQRGRELLVLIETILDSARIEVGELEVAPYATKVSDVVMSSVLEARSLTVGTAVQIKGEIQPDIPQLFVDGVRIVQALTAVIMTTARFSERGIVEVRATLSDAGDKLRIEVESSGQGLPSTERDKIFDAFKSASTARRHGALGLGLQLARAIVEIHGGGVEFEGTAAGGISFRVWLPLTSDAPSMRERASRTSLPE